WCFICDPLSHLTFPFKISRIHWCLDGSWSNSFYSDTLSCVIQSELFGKSDDCMFRTCISDPTSASNQTRNRSHVDDCSAFSADHIRKDDFCQLIHAFHIRLINKIPQRFVSFHQWFVGIQYPRCIQ